MHYDDDRNHLHVEIEAREFVLPADELTRMQRSLEPIGEAVRDYPRADLRVLAIRHPRSASYHVEARVKVPGATLLTGDHDAYLDSAFQRCVRKLVRRVEEHKSRPGRREAEAARREALDDEVVAPEAPEPGPLGRAVAAGDYRAFRNGLIGYEDWLRRRVGRWVQRYPAAQARVGDGLLIGDLVEEVYLNAFERYAQRPREVPFSDWLGGLIDPSLREMLRHPDEERENASLARTLREAPSVGGKGS
jgi:ribosome-associated translation inhibitor RaiA